MIVTFIISNFNQDSFDLDNFNVQSLFSDRSAKTKIRNPKKNKKQEKRAVVLFPGSALNVPKKAAALQGLIFPRGFLPGRGVA